MYDEFGTVQGPPASMTCRAAYGRTPPRMPSPWALLSGCAVTAEPALVHLGIFGWVTTELGRFATHAMGSCLGDNLVSLHALLSLNGDERHLLAFLQ